MNYAINTEDDGHKGLEDVWQRHQLAEALLSIVDARKAVIGFEICVISDGKRAEFMPGVKSMPVWDAPPQKHDETWFDYCRRSYLQSIEEIEKLLFIEEEVAPKHRTCVFYHITNAEELDAKLLVPRGKHDLERAEAAVNAGFPAVEPVLYELLEWLQDCNWPVAGVLSPLLASVGLPIVPELRRIFETDDEMWKYQLVSEILYESRPVTEALLPELQRIVLSPTAEQVEEELNFRVKVLLETHGFEVGNSGKENE
jgi:Domain of unknown function (DUF5071)